MKTVQAIKTELVSITPEIAAELLKKNTRNRPLSQRRAKNMAQAIKRGEWVVNGDTIRISDTGVVLDGQHRLQAIVMSGMEVSTLVVTGLPDSVFDSIDVGGAARTTGNVMAIKGEKHYNTLAAVTRLYFVWKKSGNPFHGNSEYSPTTQQQIALTEEIDFASCVNESQTYAWCSRNMTPATSAFCLLVFKQSYPLLASDFFKSLNSGIGLQEGSPILLLRDRLSEEKNNKQESLSRDYMVAIVFKAFKLYRDGASVKNLRVRLDGNAPEKDIFVI